jgi:hypothetical protein
VNLQMVPNRGSQKCPTNRLLLGSSPGLWVAPPRKPTGSIGANHVYE